MAARLNDLTGQHIGTWTVLRRAEPGDEGYRKVRNRSYWFCRCDCGVERCVQASNLINGQSRSCGAMIHKAKTVEILTKIRHERPVLHDDIHPCHYNTGVQCDLISCNGCGWVPEVEKARKEKIREERKNGEAEAKRNPHRTP